jgi:hypothetical protein
MADYLEGDLALDRRALFDAHLDECIQCAAEVTEMQDTISLLRALPDPEVPADFSSQIMRRIRSGEGDRSFVDVLRDALDTLFSPKVLYPASVAMLTVGMLLATGQIEFVDPTDPSGSSPGSKLIVQLAPGSGSSAIEREQLVGALAANPGGASRPFGAAGGERGFMQVVPIEELVVAQQQTRPPWARPSRSDPLGGAVPVVAGPGRGFDTRSSLHMPRPPLSSAESDLPSPEEWLAELERNPSVFAARLYRLTLAEQELWVRNLARHAAERGDLDAVITALRRSSTADARLLADDFAAARQHHQTARVRAGDSD